MVVVDVDRLDNYYCWSDLEHSPIENEIKMYMIIIIIIIRTLLYKSCHKSKLQPFYDMTTDTNI